MLGLSTYILYILKIYSKHFLKQFKKNMDGIYLPTSWLPLSEVTSLRGIEDTWSFGISFNSKEKVKKAK